MLQPGNLNAGMSVDNAKGSGPTPTTHGVSFGSWTFFGTGNKASAKDLKPQDYYYLSYSLTLSCSPCRSASRLATEVTPYRQLLPAWLAVIILSAQLATASDYTLSYLLSSSRPATSSSSRITSPSGSCCPRSRSTTTSRLLCGPAF